MGMGAESLTCTGRMYTWFLGMLQQKGDHGEPSLWCLISWMKRCSRSRWVPPGDFLPRGIAPPLEYDRTINLFPAEGGNLKCALLRVAMGVMRDVVSQRGETQSS